MAIEKCVPGDRAGLGLFDHCCFHRLNEAWGHVALSDDHIHVSIIVNIYDRPSRIAHS